MQDALRKVQRYHERAAECRRLAFSATSADERAEYEALAGQYEDIAQAEQSFPNAQRAIVAI